MSGGNRMMDVFDVDGYCICLTGTEATVYVPHTGTVAAWTCSGTVAAVYAQWHSGYLRLAFWLTVRATASGKHLPHAECPRTLDFITLAHAQICDQEYTMHVLCSACMHACWQLPHSLLSVFTYS
jgi:hypothetical protein